MAKAPVQVVLRMIFTKGTWRTYPGIYLVSIRHVPCNVSCWICVGGKPTHRKLPWIFLKQFPKSWNAVLRWLQECLHPECLRRSCWHFGAPWGARNDSRQVQGGVYMAVPRIYAPGDALIECTNNWSTRLFGVPRRGPCNIYFRIRDRNLMEYI